MKQIRRIGILTGGGDAPGLNAVIRGVVKSAMHTYGMEVFGFFDGFRGAVLGQGRWLGWDDVSNILTSGGTILGTTNRDNPFAFVDDTDRPDRKRDASKDVFRHFRRLKLDALVAVGGDGTLTVANQFAKLGLPVIGIPKTIDNDVRGTDQTFGFDTAMTTATEAIDRIHTTAISHHRVMLVEVMGRTAGWLALYSGIASGGDILLIPEIPYRLEAVCDTIADRKRRGKHFTILVVSEGARPVGGDVVIRQRVEGSPEPVRLGGVSAVLASQIEECVGVEARYTILGHVQRGGTPTPFDRVLATRYSTRAVELIAAGQINRVVVWKAGKLSDIPIARTGGGPRLVSSSCEEIRTALHLGVSFGNRAPIFE